MKKTSLSEEIYILKRKTKAFFCSIVFYVFRIFPVKKNKIVMWTFECGGGYGCSPKYIAQEILKRNRLKDTNYKIYWLLNDMNKPFPPEIKKIKNTLWNRAYHLSTANFWVSNTRTFYGTKKRKKTTYLQTWHGTVALKPIGKYRGDNFPKMAYIVSEYDSKMIDYALSGSKWCTSVWPDGLVYDGDILEIGSPRCDILFTGIKEKHLQLREEYNIPLNAKIMIYAPTFRGGSQKNQRSVATEEVTIDFDKVIEALETRFGGEWYVFLRLHPQLAEKIEKMPIRNTNKRLIDVSQRPDMNEIIAASDAFITDYSTAIFESFLTGNPGFIYADDLEEYVMDRGKLMFDINEIPFSVAKNSESLVENILSFDENRYQQACKIFIKKLGIMEDGKASKRIVDLIVDIDKKTFLNCVTKVNEG